MSFYLKIIIGVVLFGILSQFFPAVFAADSGPGPAGVPQLEYLFSRVICTTVPLGYTALLVVLVFAGFKYLTSAGEAKAVTSAHQTVTWGLLGVLFLAIAWLILQLVQQFTGVEVTKFTLASLPGVQGFTGSCWETPPEISTPISQSTEGCSKSSEWFRIALPHERRELIFTVYTKAEDILQLTGVLDEPRYILFIPEGFNTLVDHNLYKLTDKGRAELLSKSDVSIPISLREQFATGLLFGKFKHGTPVEEFVQAELNGIKVVEEVNKIRGSSNPLLAQVKNMHRERTNGSLVEIACPDGDFLSIVTYSPLIYLYPREENLISVKIGSLVISSQINMDRKGYWHTYAYPDGTLTTLDGKKHKFIPYEFLRSDFKRPDKGFVIEGNKLEDYLRRDLWKKLGLTDQEIEDYWQDTKPRIKQSLYYYVSLIDRSEIDRVLPMEVNPKPDTILRNMTYILPLPQFPSMSVLPLEEGRLTAPEREGFTVLENGMFVDGII